MAHWRLRFKHGFMHHSPMFQIEGPATNEGMDAALAMVTEFEQTSGQRLKGATLHKYGPDGNTGIFYKVSDDEPRRWLGPYAAGWGNYS